MSSAIERRMLPDIESQVVKGGKKFELVLPAAGSLGELVRVNRKRQDKQAQLGLLWTGLESQNLPNGPLGRHGREQADARLAVHRIVEGVRHLANIFHCCKNATRFGGNNPALTTWRLLRSTSSRYSSCSSGSSVLAG